MAKTADEAARNIRTFIPILESARTKKINEADTRTIIHKFVADVLGYDFISDVTKEFAVRGTYADFGIMVDDALKYIIEAKEIGKKLRDIHIRQAVGYAVNKGVPWCVLTNAIVWRLYRIEFQQPIQTTQVFEIDLLAVPPAEAARLLWLLSKPSMKRGEIDEFWRKRQTLNDANLLKALFASRTMIALRRELRAATSILVPIEEVVESLRGLLTEKARDLLDESHIKLPTKRRKRHKHHAATHDESTPDSEQAPAQPKESAEC
jgi:predicted type IV restriction endonuclease